MSTHSTPRNATAPDVVSARHDHAATPHGGSGAVSPTEVVRSEQLAAIAARDDAVAAEEQEQAQECASATSADRDAHQDEHNARALQHLDAAVADEVAAERHAYAATAPTDEAANGSDAEAKDEATYHMHQTNVHAAASDAHAEAAVNEAIAGTHAHGNDDGDDDAHHSAAHHPHHEHHSHSHQHSSEGNIDSHRDQPYSYDDAEGHSDDKPREPMVAAIHLYTGVSRPHKRTPSSRGAHSLHSAKSGSHSHSRSHSRHTDRDDEAISGRAQQDTEEAAAAAVAHTVEHLDDDFLSHDLPSLETLRAARVQLTEQIRHHKDEQDSLALDIEGQEGAAELYHLAARLQRLEHFCAQAHAHVTEKMTREVEQVLEMDKRHSDEEIASYAKALQAKRDKVMNKLATAKAKPMKGRADNAKQHVAEVKLDEDVVHTLQHVAENEDTAASLAAKVKKFRTMKSKLEAELISAERSAKHALEVAEQELKRAQLEGTRDARQCGELNANNATMTTAAQLLLGQLNAAHYGLDGAPTARQLLEAYKAINASPPLTPNEANDGAQPTAGTSNALVNAQSTESVHSVASRQSLSKPPLVALKSTASQRSRDDVARKERAETRASSRRSSDVASATHRDTRTLPAAPRRESIS